MDRETLKINLLSIAGSGVTMLLSSIVIVLLYKMTSDDFIRKNIIRYFLPMPPIGVAAYIIVFNMLRQYHESPPITKHAIFHDIVINTVVSSIALFLFITTIVLFVEIARKYLWPN
jgi:hypothetical protein